MASFVNLMGNDVWSEADIKARLHAEIRSEVTEYAETELNRALQGAALGMHTLSDAEMASLAHFKAATDRVAALGNAARVDMALLHETLALEAAIRAYTPDADFAALLAGFSAEAKALAVQRGTSLEVPVVPEPVTEPEVTDVTDVTDVTEVAP